MSKLQRWDGDRDSLDSLLKVIRERQGRIGKPVIVKTEPSVRNIVKTEPSVMEVADTIRKLADLTKEGFITREEFEVEKSKLLRSAELTATKPDVSPVIESAEKATETAPTAESGVTPTATPTLTSQRYTCPICEGGFADYDELQAHMESHHHITF